MKLELSEKEWISCMNLFKAMTLGPEVLTFLRRIEKRIDEAETTKEIDDAVEESEYIGKKIGKVIE